MSLTLRVRDTNGRYRAAAPAEIFSACSEILYAQLDKVQISSPADTTEFLRAKLAYQEREVFACVYLDHRHRVLGYQELFYGTIDGASVHPREVVKAALALNAAAVIFSHNHPSGVAEPSRADENLTRRLKEALALVDIRVLDHIVIGGLESVSFAERGLL